jgi:hypothetical protein
MPDAAIKVTGLREFKNNLRALDRDLPKALRMAFNDAVNIVVDDAKPGIPHRSGRAAGSVKARSTQTAGRIKAGGNRAPYYPWLDFGGRVGRRNSVRRPVIANGRYIYPAYFKARDSGRFQDALSDGLISVARRAGLAIDRGM